MNKPMKVMVAYDGSSYAEAAVDDAGRAALPPDAEILIVSVADFSAIDLPVSEFDRFSLLSRRALTVIGQAKIHIEREIEKVKRRASGAVRSLRARFPEARIRAEILNGKPAAEILRKAEQWKPDLIVVGSHSRSAIGRFFLGSVSQEIAEKAECSVRIARPASNHAGAPPGIIAGADGALAAGELARALGRRVWARRTKLRLIIAAGEPSADRASDLDPKTAALFLHLAGKLRFNGLEVSVEIKAGDLQSVLLAEAESGEAAAIFVSAGAAFDGSGLNETAAGLLSDAPGTVEVVR